MATRHMVGRFVIDRVTVNLGDGVSILDIRSRCDRRVAESAVPTRVLGI